MGSSLLSSPEFMAFCGEYPTAVLSREDSEKEGLAREFGYNDNLWVAYAILLDSGGALLKCETVTLSAAECSEAAAIEFPGLFAGHLRKTLNSGQPALQELIDGAAKNPSDESLYHAIKRQSSFGSEGLLIALCDTILKQPDLTREIRRFYEFEKMTAMIHQHLAPSEPERRLLLDHAALLLRTYPDHPGLEPLFDTILHDAFRNVFDAPEATRLYLASLQDARDGVSDEYARDYDNAVALFERCRASHLARLERLYECLFSNPEGAYLSAQRSRAAQLGKAEAVVELYAVQNLFDGIDETDAEYVRLARAMLKKNKQ